VSDYYGCARFNQTSGTNATNTLATTSGKAGRLRMVTVTYSGGTAGSATVTLTSGLGSGYNVLLNSITTSGTPSVGVYIPTTPIPVNSDDVITVVGAAVTAQTSSIAIYLDRLAG